MDTFTRADVMSLLLELEIATNELRDEADKKAEREEYGSEFFKLRGLSEGFHSSGTLIMKKRHELIGLSKKDSLTGKGDK